MAFLITRTSLIQRVRTVAHEPADSGAYTAENIVAHLQYAIEEVWGDLTSSEDGVGRIHENFTITTGDPSGYVPGPSIPLPAAMATLVAVRRSGARLRRGSPDRREFSHGTVNGVPAVGLRYWIDGPNQESNGLGTELTLNMARLLVLPDFAEGETVEWVYIEKPPLLVAPTITVAPFGPEVTLDLLEAAIVQAIVALAVAGVTSRGDDSALQRARAEAQRVIANYFKRAHDRDRGVLTLSDYAPERQRLAWWLVP